MSEKKPWRIFGRETSARTGLREPRRDSADASSLAADPGLGRAESGAEGHDRSADNPFAELFEPTMVIDLGGRLIAANAAARALGHRLNASLDEATTIEPLLAKARTTNGGGSPCWEPVPGTSGLEAIVSSDELFGDGPIFELASVLRRDAHGRPLDWVVRLIDTTPLVAALRGQRTAIDHRDRLLKLLSHDMRSPLAANLATLQHPELGSMPAPLKQTIERAAHRALHMVDSTVRLIRAECFEYTLLEVDFYHVVEEAIDATWSIAREAGVKVILEPAEHDLPILADRGSLTSAMTDLITRFVRECISGNRVLCNFSIEALQGMSVITLHMEDAEKRDKSRMRSETSYGLASISQSEIDVSNHSSGLDFFRTIIKRHSGTTICETEPGVGRKVSVTIPMAGPGVGRP
jgi:signal transduction histidine kinase